MDPKYWQALMDFPSPQSPKALAWFLGMVGCYKHFLKDLSKDSTDLHKLKTTAFTQMDEEHIAVGCVIQNKNVIIKKE